MKKRKLLAFFIAILVGCSLALLSCAEAPEEAASPDEMAPAVEPEPEKPEPGDMVLIPAGTFVMGTDEKRPSGPPLEVPTHEVDLPAYYIDVYEVTHAQWIEFTTQSDYVPKGNWRQFYNIGKEYFPVTNVIWEDAKAYCEWTGKRLPTEAEWEKAARGPEGYPYPWGEKFDFSRTNCNEIGYRNTVEVGSVDGDKSPHGLYDMMGNAQEWTSEELEPYPGSPIRGHEAFRQGYIAVRGGSYAMKCRGMGLYTRSAYLPGSQYGLGFRCARDAEEEATEEETQQ